MTWAYHKCCVCSVAFVRFVLLGSACWSKARSLSPKFRALCRKDFSRQEKWLRKCLAQLWCYQHGEDKFHLGNGHRNVKDSDQKSWVSSQVLLGYTEASAASFLVPFLQYISALKGRGGFYLHVFIIIFAVE